jgi:hypothetical protein
MLFPIRMTFHTVLEVSDPFFDMFGAHLSLIVFMTAITRIGCEASRMASRTACSTSMIQRECVLTIELSRGPGTGIVADCAVGAILSVVLIILLMTGVTICGRAFVLLVDMA